MWNGIKAHSQPLSDGGSSEPHFLVLWLGTLFEMPFKVMAACLVSEAGKFGEVPGRLLSHQTPDKWLPSGRSAVSV